MRNHVHSLWVLAGTLAGATWLAAGAATPAMARSVIGPASDFQTIIPVDAVNGPCVPGSFPTYTYYNGNYIVYDRFTLNCNPEYGWVDRMIRGVSYLSSRSGNFTKGKVTVTTVYGTDLNPEGVDPIIGGLTPASPELIFSSEEIVGRSRKIYPASSSSVVPISGLPALLGKGFDLSPFQGDPNSVVYVFSTTIPATDIGLPSSAVLFSEGFANTFHVGYGDFGGAFGPGNIPGTLLVVTHGDIDILGVKNGINGRCIANPKGNCLDLIGNTGSATVQAIPAFDLDPKYSYTVQFNAIAQDVKGDIHFNVSLGHQTWDAIATAKTQTLDLVYTPTAAEPQAPLTLMSVTDIDGQHGPVLSGLVLCAHKVGAANLKCPAPIQ